MRSLTGTGSPARTTTQPQHPRVILAGGGETGVKLARTGSCKATQWQPGITPAMMTTEDHGGQTEGAGEDLAEGGPVPGEAGAATGGEAGAAEAATDPTKQENNKCTQPSL